MGEEEVAAVVRIEALTERTSSSRGRERPIRLGATALEDRGSAANCLPGRDLCHHI
jgi:hypothetical protein